MARTKRHSDVSTRSQRRSRARPANLVAVAIGILAIALGVWALIKTGINTDHIFTPSKEVLGLPHTPPLALGEIAFGILLLIASVLGRFGAFLVALLGVLAVACGVIVVSDYRSARVDRWTAANHDNGWLAILIGVVLVLSAVLPLFVSARAKRTRQTIPAAEPLLADSADEQSRTAAPAESRSDHDAESADSRPQVEVPEHERPSAATGMRTGDGPTPAQPNSEQTGTTGPGSTQNKNDSA